MEIDRSLSHVSGYLTRRIGLCKTLENNGNEALYSSECCPDRTCSSEPDHGMKLVPFLVVQLLLALSFAQATPLTKD